MRVREWQKNKIKPLPFETKHRRHIQQKQANQMLCIQYSIHECDVVVCYHWKGEREKYTRPFESPW